MRPTRLEIEGFTSFRQKAILDFNSLDLFVITGPTGAGKTSLIDAVIYALYGRTPRIGDKDASDLISQGAERMRVLLEFRAGNKSYRLLRTLKRGSSQKLQLEIQDAQGEWEAISNRVFEVRAKIEEILGIDFDGFTKSIVLPQGEFDRFLRGDPGERRRILADLLRLGIYEEMGKRARQIEQNTRLEQSVTEQHITSTYADVTQERKATLETKCKELTTRQEQLSEQSKLIQRAQPCAIELSKQRAKRAEAVSEVAATSRSLEKAQTSSASAQANAARYKKRLDKLEELITTCGYNNKRHLELSSLLPLAQEREQCQRAISDSQGDSKTVTANLRRLESTAAKTKHKWEQLAKESRVKDQAAQHAKKRLDAAKKQYGSSDAIAQVIEDLRVAQGQLQERTEVEHNIAEIEEKIGLVEKQITELREQHDEAEIAFKDARANLDDLQQQHAAIEIRQHLRRGEPCPVCDQTVSVLPTARRHVALQRAKEILDQREKARDRCNTQLLKKQNLFESLPNQSKALRKSLKSIESSMATSATKAERVLGKSPGKNAIEQLEQVAEQLSILEGEYERTAAELREIQEGEADAREAHNNDANEVKLLSQRLESLEKATADKSARLALLEKQLTGQPELRVLAEELKQMEKARKQQEAYDLEKKQEEALYLSAEKQHVIAEAEAATLQQRLTQLQASIAAATKCVASLEEKLRGYISVPKGTDEITYLDNLRSKTEEESRELAGSIETTKKDLQGVIRGLTELIEKRQQLNALKAKAELYRELGVALKADQFIRFVVEEALGRLAEHGTQHLIRLSSGRYSFATETDDFLVIDHWNADESRSVNTLSGGESFLASLSLALALGDALVELSTEAGRFNLDSLFLDEGFSTLDPETLDVVVQAIEALAGGERLVGIISHVPEMAERFTAQVEVNKAVGGSSIVIKGENRQVQKYATA